jgi:hypothetical protein
MQMAAAATVMALIGSHTLIIPAALMGIAVVPKIPNLRGSFGAY